MEMLVRLTVVLMFCGAFVSGCSQDSQEQPAEPGQKPKPKAQAAIVIRSAAAENEDALKAGKAAAEALKKAMGDTTPKAVLVTDCFDEEALKAKVFEGVTSIFPPDVVVGFAGYGSFTQGGSLDADSVGVLGIGGDGIDVQIAFVKDMGAAGLSIENDKDKLTKVLGDAAKKLAGQLTKKKDSRLLIAIPDAHSPKNQLFMDGLQEVVGKDFPITGGSISKNDGETFVYYKGKLHKDSAIALMLSLCSLPL